jgi:hypothetical protein
MNQIYDPMANVDQTGSMVSQIGRNVTGVLGNFFQQNAQWKQFKGEQKSEEDAKKKYYDTAIEVFKERGIDASSVNLPQPTDKRFATAEDYAENLSKSVEHLFVGSGNRPTSEDATRIGIQQQPGVKENLARQSFLDQYDTERQIDLNGMAGDQGKPQGEYSNANEQVSPMLLDVLGITPKATEADSFEEDYAKPMTRFLMDDVREKRISAKEAMTELRELEKDRRKERLENTRYKRESERRKEELHAAGVYGSGDTNEIVDPKTGEPTVVTRENVMDVGIGQRKYPPKSGRGGSGSGSGSEDALKQQEEAWDQYNDVERQRLSMVKGRDEKGNAVPFDPESFAQKTNESAIRLLAYDLTASGVDLGASNASAIKTIDAPMAIVTRKASDPVIDAGNGQWALNMSNKKIRSALLEAARNGIPASQILLEIRRAKGLNPARQW